ncbi:hypothetical protein ACJX0J_038868, partial [Zea mays]
IIFRKKIYLNLDLSQLFKVYQVGNIVKPTMGEFLLIGIYNYQIDFTFPNLIDGLLLSALSTQSGRYFLDLRREVLFSILGYTRRESKETYFLDLRREVLFLI